jgi:transposase
MIYIKNLSEVEIVTLKEAQKNSPKAHFRNRCFAIELSFRGKSVPYIANLLGTRTDTIYTWMNRWNSMGIVGLMVAPGRGVKSKLDTFLLETNITSLGLIKEKIALNPQKLDEVAVELSAELNLTITYSQLKNFIKKNSDILGAG